MHRRNFIKLSAILAATSPLLPQCKSSSAIPGSIIGASAATGHLLRDKKDFGAPAETEQREIVIVGGGISGLSAARYLQRQGATDFLLLDLEQKVGGNASFGQNEISPFAWGAHYVPTPNNTLTDYLELLQESGVITGYDKEDLPIYNEYHLCFDPQDRLYINGRWQEGLVPRYGVPRADLQQIDRFLQQMEIFRYAKGSDGREAFAIPVNESSKDIQYTALDNITMKAWMLQNGFTSSYLHWYVNYCTRDDFGTTHQQASAWAGIHYFASRKGRGANAAAHDVLTWPEGNGWLVKQLVKNTEANLRTGAVAVQVAQKGREVQVDYFDVGTKKLKRIRARQCILAVPQFVAARLLHDEDRLALVKQHCHYVPWMVANLEVKGLKERSGAPRSWDNVLYDSESLGYVVASHQLVQQEQQKHNLTFYLPLTGAPPTEARMHAYKTNHATWVQFVLNELKKVHPNIEQATKRVDIMLWGHAMLQPLPGLMQGTLRSLLQASVGNTIHFAHTDLAGISIFEEGFYQGLHAAKKVLQYLP